MRFLAGLTNYIIYTVVGFTTLAIIAGVSTDLSFYSDDFMSDNEIKMVYRLDGSSQRFVASSEEVNYVSAYVPVDQYGINYGRYAGLWNVHNFVNSLAESIDKHVEVTIELIGTSQIRVYQLKNFVDRDIFLKKSFVDYDISRVININEIELMRKVADGREILKLNRDKPILEGAVSEAQSVVYDLRGKEAYNHEDDQLLNVTTQELSLEINNVYHPQRSASLIQGMDVEGGVELELEVTELEFGQQRTIVKGISNLNVMIVYNDAECEIDISYVEVRDGGSFQTEITDCRTNVPVSAGGIITRSGKDSYQVVLQGPYQGASLRFADSETIAKTRSETEARENNAKSNMNTFDFGSNEEPQQQEYVENNDNEEDQRDYSDEGEYEEGDVPEVVDTEEAIEAQQDASFERMDNGLNNG